jgi:Protein of unknown function (DUF2791).
MDKTIASWFFMRPGFTTFRLEPEKHRQFLFGTDERKVRDSLLGEIEGSSYGGDGFKGVVFGDYGRGKTHLSHNLEFEIERAGLKIKPIYIKCSNFTSKAPFPSLFEEMITRHETSEIKRVATAYARLVADGKAQKIDEIVHSEDIALVMSEGLTVVNDSIVRNCMRWLGGEAKVSMESIKTGITPQLTDSRKFGSVMRGLSHMYATVDGKGIQYFIDEAERFNNISNADTFATWLVCLRELTEIPGVGLMFFVGAITRNDIPVLLMQDEIRRRIGVVNYIELLGPGRDDLRAFMLELFATCIRKGELPKQHRNLLPDDAKDASVPAELIEITGGDVRRLETFPFEPDAFDEFIENALMGSTASKPSEVLIRILKAAQRAIKTEQRTIGISIVNEVSAEGMS